MYIYNIELSLFDAYLVLCPADIYEDLDIACGICVFKRLVSRDPPVRKLLPLFNDIWEHVETLSEI